MNEKLKPCWCGNLPEFISYIENGEVYVSYMCDQRAAECLPHFLLVEDSGSEEEVRQDWNRMMDAIEKHYREGGQQ